MKKLFLGILYIVVVVMTFTYYLISAMNAGRSMNVTLLVQYGYTGISIIGFIFLIPAFVFVIIAMCMNSVKVDFLRDVFNFFASIFTIGTLILGLCDSSATIDRPYVFVVLGICSLVLLAGSAYGITTTLLNEKKQKDLKTETKEEPEA